MLPAENSSGILLSRLRAASGWKPAEAKIASPVAAPPIAAPNAVDGDDCAGAQWVADIRPNRKDAVGGVICNLYFRRPPDYAVYRTKERGVLVHFSDNRDDELRQRSEMAPLMPLRDEIDGLVQGWRNHEGHGFFGLTNPRRLNSKAECCDRRVGGALMQALERDVPGAQVVLEKIKADVLNERIAWARFEYLLTAFAAVLVAMFTAWLLGSLLPFDPGGDAPRWADRMRNAGLILLALAATIGASIWTADRDHPVMRGILVVATLAIPVFAILIWPATEIRPVDAYYEQGVDMWRGAAAGGIGAFFSIALAIRGRTVLPDLLRTSNMMDAVLRILIGVIAGTVLIALIRGQVVTFPFAKSPLTPVSVLIVGFIAGFAERLVPDLLEKVAAKPVEFNAELAASRQRQARAAEDSDAKAARRDGTGTPAAREDAVNDNVVDTDMDAPREGFDALNDDENTQDEELPQAVGGVAKP